MWFWSCLFKRVYIHLKIQQILYLSVFEEDILGKKRIIKDIISQWCFVLLSKWFLAEQ